MAKVKMNNKSWSEISGEACLYFSKHADWLNHFSLDVIKEAQEYYAISLDEFGQLRAAEMAWHYAQGASRFMQEPTNTTDNG